MPTPKKKKKSAQDAVSSAEAEKLYDLLMGAIEPDLTNANIGRLEKKYKKETAQEKEDRMERYDRAFALLKHRFDFLLQILDQDASLLRHAAIAEKKGRSAKRESKKLRAIERSIDEQ